MPLPDSRIRLQSSKIDFTTAFGVSGLDVESFPGPNQQPRYDWMRSVLLGLLSNQASVDEPDQRRDGTLWFDLNDPALKIFSESDWTGIASVIKLDEDDDGEPITLADVYSTMQTLVGNKPTAFFGGSSGTDGATSIPIPAALRVAGGSGSRPFVFVDGALLDPRLCQYVGSPTPTSIKLTGGLTIDSGQSFSVVMLALSSTYFSSTEVVL